MINELLENKNISHKTDILTCIASLSSDEKFTPPNTAKKILDLLPENIWTDDSITFLDPVSKSGVFLREITTRLIEGLENKIPDLEERITHILTKQVFGIGTSELTSFISRRSLYCSKYANGKYSIVSFDDEEGNLKYPVLDHSWTISRKENNYCVYCGVREKDYDRGAELESFAYPFIHIENINELFNMKFDVIVGNPPYHMKDGGGKGDSAKPIYNLFVEQAIKLNPTYLTMIIPSKWMKGGKGLDPFRKKIMNDKRMKYIYDFEDEKECFEGINLAGGVCYFLWDKNYNGKIDYIYKPLGELETKSKRFLTSKYSETIIRDVRQLKIIEKVYEKKEEKFSNIVSKRMPYGIGTDLFNNPSKYGYKEIPNKPRKNSIKVYGVKGHKGGAKRVIGYIDEQWGKEYPSLNKYKLFHSYAYTHSSTVPPEIIIGKPGEVCTETFLEIGPFKTKNEAENCLSYIKTKFFRGLLSYNRIQQNLSRSTFDLIPIQDFNKQFSDKVLYSKYKLDKKEIEFIEKYVKPMD